MIKLYMKPYHRESKLEDVLEVSRNLRWADVREVVSLGSDPEGALISGYLYSTIKRTIVNSYNVPVGMYGVVPIPQTKNSGTVWMLGTDKLLDIKVAFLKQSKSEVKKMNDAFPHLCNIIESRNELHLKWIKWCGFKIIGERMINNHKFYEFCRLADDRI